MLWVLSWDCPGLELGSWSSLDRHLWAWRWGPHTSCIKTILRLLYLLRNITSVDLLKLIKVILRLVDTCVTGHFACRLNRRSSWSFRVLNILLYLLQGSLCSIRIGWLTLNQLQLLVGCTSESTHTSVRILSAHQPCLSLRLWRILILIHRLE
jgi:hypothetical protein